MVLRTDAVLHRYAYIFKGIATYRGQPCAKASVLVRLQAGDKSVAKGVLTDADGSYSVEMAIDAEDRAPVDWSMEAFTPDFQKVELNGRQIVQREEIQEQEPEQSEQHKKPITVTNPVEFSVSLSK
jgi:hypothetical protein